LRVNVRATRLTGIGAQVRAFSRECQLFVIASLSAKNGAVACSLNWGCEREPYLRPDWPQNGAQGRPPSGALQSA